MSDAMNRREIYLRAQAVVSRVYALPETEREAFVERETGLDPTLRDEVRWLLSALTGPHDDFLETTAFADVLADSGELKVPAPRNYNLIRPLGEGGMGVVYLAERTEGDLKQIVALKLLNLTALLNPIVVNRFLTERQLLARLNHPNIARLIDAGALADGRPFLAMEFVEGIELDRYCEQHGLGLPERLQLFSKVCRAVQYAHQHLIIHRDLKPANVLVTADGEPKLVDFGIARTYEGGMAAPTVGAERIMTLAYASPEQLTGGPLSTATDVYSLGIMLYELLAGDRPWGHAAEPLSLAREIERSVPVPPSVKRRRTLRRKRQMSGRTTAIGKWFGLAWRWRLPGDLPRDLDAIVLKALRLNPDERYESPLALAEDIRRFQTNRPVQALRGQAWYWTCKYLRRNWISLAVSTGVVAMTAAYIADRQMQLDRTERERAKVAQVRDFLVGLFKEVQPAYAQGQNISAKEMLDRGAKRMEAAPPEDPTTRLVLNNSLAETYVQLGEFRVASELSDRSVRIARAMQHVDSETLVSTLLVAAQAKAQVEDSAASLRLAEEALALAGRERDINPEYRASALNSIATALRMQGRPPAEFEPYFQRAIELYDRIAPGSGSAIAVRHEYAQALLLHRLPDKALAVLQKARELAGSAPEANTDKLAIDSLFGQVLFSLNRFEEGEAVLRKTLEAQIRVLGTDHMQTGVTRARLAFFFLREGNWVEAETLLQGQLALTRRTQNSNSTSTLAAMLNVMHALSGTKKFVEGEQLAREALALVRNSIAPDQQPDWNGMLNVHLARMLAGQGRLDEAQTLLDKGMEQLLANPDGVGKGAIPLAWTVAGEIAEAKGEDARAEQAYRKGAATDRLGSLLARHKHFEEAEQVLLPAFEKRRKAMSPTAPIMMESRAALAALYEQWGKPDVAARVRKGGEAHGTSH